MFKHFKPTFEMSQYLLTVSNVKLRQYTTQHRLSPHNLLIEYGRHILGISHEIRDCTHINGSLEDEYHFVMVCESFII